MVLRFLKTHQTTDTHEHLQHMCQKWLLGMLEILVEPCHQHVVVGMPQCTHSGLKINKMCLRNIMIQPCPGSPGQGQKLVKVNVI